MEKTLKEVRHELHEWVTDREKTVRGIRDLATSLQKDYEHYKHDKTVGLSTGIAAGVLAVGGFLTVITGGTAAVLFAIPAAFIGAAGGATVAVSSITWNSTQKKNLADAESLLREEEKRVKKIFELLKNLQSEVKQAIPPSLKDDQAFWERFQEKITALLPFFSLAWKGATPYVQAGTLVAGSLGANASLVEQFGVVPWSALSAGGKVIAGSFQALNVGFLIYNCVELALLIKTESPDRVKKLNEVADFMKQYCPSQAKIDQTVDSLREVVRDSAKSR